MGDRKVDLIPIIYTSIYCGFGKIDDELSYYAQTDTKGQFILTMVRNFAQYDIVYQKNYIFSNRITLNDTFEKLFENDYQNTLVLVKNLNLTKKMGLHTKKNKENYLYEYACTASAELIKSSPVMNKIMPDLEDMKKNNVRPYTGLSPAMTGLRGSDSMQNVLSTIPKTKYSGNITFALNVYYPANKVFTSNTQWLKGNGFDVVNIFGNGATVHANSKDRDEYKWIVTSFNQVYMVHNLTVEGFNTAIDNREGYVVLNNVTLKNNRMDYIRDRDDGAAILNGGVVFCNNCTFVHNYAKNGGAIFSQGLLNLNNCTFEANRAYGIGNDVLNVDQGIVFVDKEEINGTQGVVTYVKSISSFASKLTAIVAAIGSFLSGLAAGVVTCVVSGGNIAAGVAVGICVGVLVGGALGSVAAYVITSHQYNLQFNRITTAITIIATCVALGILGGVIGAMVVGPKLLPDSKPDVNNNLQVKSEVEIKTDYNDILDLAKKTNFDSINQRIDFKYAINDFMTNLRATNNYDLFMDVSKSLYENLYKILINSGDNQLEFLKMLEDLFARAWMTW